MEPSQPNAILPSQLMHKNRLQEYTQRSGLPLPNYHNINEGFPHAPKFRSTVLVDGQTYTSTQTFPHRKAAEQDAARLALESIAKRKKDEGHPLVLQDALICKSILVEFAIKNNHKLPTYRTRTEGQLHIYVSSVAFNGEIYKGVPAGSRKMAEQLAARSAILAILGSNLGDSLREIVKSKGNTHSLLSALNHEGFKKSNLPQASQPENSSQQACIPPKNTFAPGGVANRPCVRMSNREPKRKPEPNLDASCEKRKMPKASQSESSSQLLCITPENVAFPKHCSKMTSTGPSKEARRNVLTQNLKSMKNLQAMVMNSF